MLAPRVLPKRGRRPVIGKIVISTLVLLVLLLLVAVLAHAPIFSISHLIVRGDPSGKVSKQITSLAQNQNLFLLDEAKIRHEVLTNPQIKQVTFEKSLPNSLTVTVNYRDPAFSWQGSNATFLVDDSGFVFQLGSASGLPQVVSSDNLEIGKKMNPDTLSKVLAIIKGTNSAATSISIQASTYQATLTGGTTVTFDPTGDLTAQSQALQLIIAKAKIDGKLPRSVDLRFPKPVVTF